jgi:putative ABC transport system permease protein
MAGIGGSVRAAIGVTVVHVPWPLLTAMTSSITAFLTTGERSIPVITTKE